MEREEEEILLKETTRRTVLMPFTWATLSCIRSKYGSAHLSPAAPKVSEQDVKSERLPRLLGEEAGAMRWSREVSVVLLSSASTEPHRPSKANISTKWLSAEWRRWRPAGQTTLRNVTEPQQRGLEGGRVSPMWLAPHKASLILFSYLKGFGNAASEHCGLFRW